MDALECIMHHQSVRNYTGEPLSSSQMQAIEYAIVQTSSSCFLQAITTIKIRERSKLEQLATMSGNQEHIAKCACFYMFCLDTTKFQHIADLQAPYSFKLLFLGINDASLACQNALIAAEALGLGGVIIGGYKNDIQGVSDLLKLPKGVVPLLGLCLGVVDQAYLEQQKPRLPHQWLIMDEEFKDPYNSEELATYDEEVRQYYESRKYNSRSETWSEGVKHMLKGQVDASHIIKYLKQQGFEFF